MGKNCYDMTASNLTYCSTITGIPYITTDEKKQRKFISITNAQRDLKIWGEDAYEFRLRDIAKYHELSTIFGEQMIDKENPQNNRYCPGKDFALQMIINFLKAFLARKQMFNLSRTVKDKIRIGVNNLTTQWEFEIKNTQVKE